MRTKVLVGCTLFLAVAAVGAAAPTELKIEGDWEVRVIVHEPQAIAGTVHVAPPEVLSVVAEKHERLPLFQPKAGGWAKGAQLIGVRAQETTTPYLLDPESLVLQAAPEPESPRLRRGEDFEVDLVWGTFGRTAASTIKEGQPVFASYRYAKLRIDAVVLTKDGRIILRQGEPRSAAPLPPEVGTGEQRVANIWLPGRLKRLAPEHLFPVLETAYPAPPKPQPSPAERLLPRTMKKLQTGERLRILAWGDSVTVGTYLPDWQHNRWQEQFVTRLKERFPKANVELSTEAWGGRNTDSYFAEPPGSEHNYKEKVLAKKPDLIVSEFVNDGGLSPAQVDERYGRILSDFQSIGAEWIILTPHYVRPDWMGLNRERDIDDDPRPYVTGLRRFTVNNHTALADASVRYGRLWRQGIPYSTLMLNSINHPDARGMKLFADALMELFP
jgi:lysophospholipase L1-like esterase